MSINYYDDEEDDEFDGGNPYADNNGNDNSGGGDSGGNKLGDKAKEKGQEAVQKGMQKGAEKAAQQTATTTAASSGAAAGGAAAGAGAGAAAGGAAAGGAAAAGSAGLMASLSYVLFWVALVILIIFIIIGLIMFFVTMPGMVMDKLKALFKEIGNYVAAFFGADTTEQIDDAEVGDTLDYLEQMGWDVKAEGFLTGYIEDWSDLSSDEKDKYPEDSYTIDEDTGVVRSDEDDGIAFARSDFIFTYIMSDNYVYTLKNDNLAVQDKDDNWLEKFFKGWATAAYKVKNFFFGPLYDSLGITDLTANIWGKGLIGVYYDKGSDPEDDLKGSKEGVGRIDHMVNKGSAWDWNSIEINTKTKKLSIKRRTELFNNNNALEFSLDGWTGRYGMPLEFLLAIHKATMMPDLAADMVTSFPTEIKLLLHETSGEAQAGYKCTDGTYATYEKIENEIHNMKSDDFFSAFLNWFDDWIQTSGEVEAARRIKIDVGPPHCTGCTVTQMAATPDGHIIKKSWGNWVYDQNVYDPNDNTKILHKKGDKFKSTSEYPAEGEELKTVDVIDTACQNCKDLLAAINSKLKSNQDYDFQAYTPYIAEVADHWYRDVYFVVNKNYGDKNYTGDLDFVDYDYNYEALVDERWTLYETYTDNPDDGYKYNPKKAGEFIIFEVDSNGKYKKEGGKYVLFDGTFSDARPTLLFVKDGNEYIEYTGSRENLPSDKKVYRFNSEGEYVEYTGDIAVAKKAVTKSSTDEDFMEDIAWKDNSSNVWSAYDLEDTSSGWEPLFTEEEINKAATEMEKKVMKNAFINLNLTGNLVQVGEGQRTETNQKIKKMFLNNNYFRYSGDEETAEIITALRDKVGQKRGSNKSKYGAIKSDEMDVSITRKNIEGDNETYYVKDYVGKVTLNQDSLTAFSMLENMHTLDSDYIYRDFKELIVELGYFEKEEITGATAQRVMAFPVPEIGSGGYPDRAIDKWENESGTGIHSEGDIKAYEKNKLVAAYMQAAKDLEDGVTDEDIESGAVEDDETVAGIDLSSVSSVTGTPDLNSNVGSMTGRSQVDIEAIVGSMGQDFERIAESGDGYDYKVKCGQVEYTHYYQFKGSYAEKTFTWSGATKTLHRAACGPTSCVNILTGYGEDVNPTDNIVGISFSATMDGIDKFMEDYGVTGELISGGDTAFIAAIEEAFSEGRPIIALMTARKTGDTFWTSGGHFVPMIGQDKSGNVIPLDSGSSNAARHTYSGGIEGLMSCMTGLWVADEAPDGMSRSGQTYEGYQGNEAVVSPVTGVLLEYGTYEPNDPQDEKDVEYRINSDLLYGKDKNKNLDEEETATSTTEENANNNTEEPAKPEGPEVIDRVGYAKILVLDAESYQRLEANTSNKWGESNSLVKISESKVIEKNKDGEIEEDTRQTVIYRGEEGSDPKKGFVNDDYKDWSEIDKTVYGYKEFAELYNAVGIAGNVIYIDGFVTEKPATDMENSDPDAGTEMCEQEPDGVDLELSDFAIAETSLDLLVPTDEESEDEDTLPESLYEKEEAYKMASKKAYETAKSEVDLRNLAAPAVAINIGEEDEMIFIKEGTVLGRTMTDKELITKIRENPPEGYEAYRVEESTSTATGLENEDRVMGNYIRTIFRDLDDTVIENVEDYMKLDTAGAVRGDQEYQAWEGDLEILAEIMVHEASYSYLSISNRFKNDKEEADFEMYCMGYSVVNKLLEQNKPYYGHLYDDTRTDRSPLAQVVTSAWYGPREKLEAYINGSHPGCFTEKELEYAEYCLSYDCTSIKKPSDTALSAETIADGYSTTPAGSVIPRAMCQQGGYGDGAPGQSNITLVGFWDHYDDGTFGKGDELWGVQKNMLHLME